MAEIQGRVKLGHIGEELTVDDLELWKLYRFVMHGEVINTQATLAVKINALDVMFFAFADLSERPCRAYSKPVHSMREQKARFTRFVGSLTLTIPGTIIAGLKETDVLGSK